MAIGVWLHLTEDHEHEHEHEVLAHAHPHVHDVHHQHDHGPDDPLGEPHTHAHQHRGLKHTHGTCPTCTTNIIIDAGPPGLVTQSAAKFDAPMLVLQVR